MNLMIAAHGSVNKEDAAFSIRYEFVQGKTSYSGALFVSGGTNYGSAVIKAYHAFEESYGGQVFVSVADEKC